MHAQIWKKLYASILIFDRNVPQQSVPNREASAAGQNTGDIRHLVGRFNQSEGIGDVRNAQTGVEQSTHRPIHFG
jgi:hypothetical protein